MKQSIEKQIEEIHHQIEEMNRMANSAGNCACAMGPKMEVARLTKKLQKLEAEAVKQGIVSR